MMQNKAIEEAQKQVDAAKDELEKKTQELNRIKRLTESYPDIERYTGRWNRVVMSSKSVNASVDRVFFRYNCSCCSDSPFEAWPYIQTEHGEIYSNPAKFTVGEQHWISGAKPLKDWDKPLIAAGISSTVIERIQSEFDRFRKERKELVEEDSYVEPEPDPLV